MSDSEWESTEEAREAEGEASPDEPFPMAAAHVRPLPGVMDFIGAHVGGELAEERWR